MRRLQQAERGRFGVGFVASTLHGGPPELIRRHRAAGPGVEVASVEPTSLEQITALKEGRIDVGFGRIPSDDPAITRRLPRDERLVAALPFGHPSPDAPGPLRLDDPTREPLIVRPKAPRPSHADRVLALFRARPDAVDGDGGARGADRARPGRGPGRRRRVPAGVRRLRRDGVAHRDLDGDDAISPVILSHRRDDVSAEVAVVLTLVGEIHREDGIASGS